MHDTSERFTLRQLPLPAKLVVSVFLCSVGLGYFSALIQLHFKQADAGTFMPTPKNVIRAYHGDEPAYPLVSVINGDEKRWNAKNMRAAFFHKSEDWDKSQEAALRPEREAERQLVLAWLKAKAPKEAYDVDEFPLPKGFESITVEYKAEKENHGKLTSVLKNRCVRCHGPGGEKEDVPLDTYAAINKLMQAEPEGRLSAEKLAQSTHAHLLTFCLLFGLTGLVFSFSSYPVWFRCFLAPLVLTMQVIDVGCWWLARIDGPLGEMFALAILFTGGLVGSGLFFQIVLSLFNMYGARGRAVLVGLFLAAGAGAFVGKTMFLDKYLEEEKKAAAQKG
jgi:hypothetical protein